MHIIVLGFIDGPHSGTYITSAFKPIEIEKNKKNDIISNKTALKAFLVS
jgi:hypothetical protein